MLMYKEFNHLSTSHTMENGFKFTPNASSLERVVENFMLLQKFSASSVREGRGVMCNSELKCSEIAHTVLALHTFLFGNETATTGACYHQYPVAKVSQSIPKADFYVCGLHEDKLPGNPIVLGHMKSEDLVSASKETAAYCVKAIEVFPGKKYITVNLGLAMTRNRAKLFVNLAGNCIMFQTEVCEVRSVDKPCTKAFFTVLYGAVHSLIKQPVEYENPCFVPFADRDVEQIGRRVFLDQDKQTVYKLYDNILSEDPSASNQALKQLGGDYLHNVSITQLNKRFHCLQYDYISAMMKPHQLCQFAFIMKDLNRLHLKGYVHGDIRKENLLFNENYAWMIDFDLTQLEDTLYPSNHNSSIEERHRDARASRPMKKSHDLYALSIIIEHFFGHSGQTTYNLLRGPKPDLNTIAQETAGWTHFEFILDV